MMIYSYSYNLKSFLVVSVVVICFGLAINANAECSVSATGVAFGGYQPFGGSPVTSTGNVQVSCSSLVNLLFNINVSLSTGSSGDYLTRQMMSGTNPLGYNLYRDAAHNEIWGDGSAGTFTVSHSQIITVIGVTYNDTIFGLLPSGQNVPAGSYSDSIIVTVEY